MVMMLPQIFEQQHLFSQLLPQNTYILPFYLLWQRIVYCDFPTIFQPTLIYSYCSHCLHILAENMLRKSNKAKDAFFVNSQVRRRIYS